MGTEIFTFPVKNGEVYLNTVKRMEVGRAFHDFSRKLEALKDLYGLLASLLKIQEQKYLPSAKEQKIRPAVEYLVNGYDKHITNGGLAAVSGISTVYFRKLFTEVMGMPLPCATCKR